MKKGVAQRRSPSIIGASKLMQTLLALIAPLVSVTEEAAATAVLGDVLILGVDVVEDISLDRALAS